MSYDVLKDAKKLDLARPREDLKPMYIVMDLEPTEEHELIQLLQEYRDVFA